ncbi:ligase-associated DNA damage response endonuclease PdeM [Albidovulum sp.]|uniref:ligase-associated DNA damage response endonuclease PdeM n=1 Tax=Albidovulum sp. TaxID=1872424 RepID=UPI0039B99E96
MNAYAFDLAGARLSALPSGALFWAGESCLVVSDLHLGRSGRFARRAGALLPPYEVEETLARLDADIAGRAPRVVICLGDSFDDPEAGTLDERAALWLARLMAGRRWVWIAGNHDPGPLALAGEHRAEMTLGPLTFRHEARAGAAGEVFGEVSGHYHPKVRLAGGAIRCFLVDRARAILPAYGTYTGGLSAGHHALGELMGEGALAILTGRTCRPMPMPRGRNR